MMTEEEKLKSNLSLIGITNVKRVQKFSCKITNVKANGLSRTLACIAGCALDII